MKRFINFLVTAVIIIAVAASAAAYWFGIKAEGEYNAFISDAESQIQQIRLRDSEYNRGVFSSKSRTIVEIPGPSGLDAPIQFTLRNEIKHGPFPGLNPMEGKWLFRPLLATVNTEARWNPSARQGIPEAFSPILKKAYFKNKTSIYMNRNSKSVFDIPPFKALVGQGAKEVLIDWKGLSGNMTFDAETKKYKGYADAPRLDIAAGDGDLTIKSINFGSDMHKAQSGLFLGDASFKMGLFEFRENKTVSGKGFKFEGLFVKTSSKAVGSKLSSSFDMELDSYITGNGGKGEGSLNVELKNLDVESLMRLKKAMKEVQAESMEKGKKGTERALLSKISEFLPDLMKGSPELLIKGLKVRTESGELKGRAKVIVDGSNSEMLINPFLMLGAVSAEADMTATEGLTEAGFKSFIKNRILKEQRKTGEDVSGEKVDDLAASQTQAMLDKLVNGQILARDGGIYSLSVRYDRGNVTLNNRPIKFQDLLRFN